MRSLFGFLGLVVFFLLSGCYRVPCGLPGGGECATEGNSGAEQGGGTGIVLHLPIAKDSSTLCVQGAGGTWSHDGDSTRHDLDLDTSNWADQEVFAPIGGIARVHTDDASSGFGYHVNIEVDDELYVVLGHFKEIFVGDGQEVGQGQLLGYEGCTGYCTGDHIHIGLHEGDATEPAENGTSIEVSYLVEDLGSGSALQGIGSDDFVCGLQSAGDPQDGHTYRSALPVPLWHPGGTLVKVPDNPMTYVLSDGQGSWISNEDVFWSWKWDFADVAPVSDEEFQCYGEGSHIGEQTTIDAAWDMESGALWLRSPTPEDRQGRVRQVRDTAWDAVLESWGIPFWEPPVLSPQDAFFDGRIPGEYATFREGTILKEASRSDVYVVSDGWAMPVQDWNTYLMLGFFPRQVLTVDDGAVAQVMDGHVGDCAVDVMCIDREAVVQCGGGLDLDDGVGGEGGNHDNEDPPDEGTQTESQGEGDTDVDTDTDSDVDTGIGLPPISSDLSVTWTTPFGTPAQSLTLSGEYIFADGSYGFTWRELQTATGDASIVYEVPGAGSGDTFRFSVEYTDMAGNVSWSCIAPFPPGTRQGTASASFDGTSIPVTNTGDPSGLTNGCGLFLTVP